MSDFIHFCHALSENAKQANIRYLVVIEGDAGWTNKLVGAFLQRYQHPLWAGETSPEHIPSVRLKKAKQFLGRECDCLIFNAEHAFDAEALGALSGTVTGGGVLLLLAPSTWFRQTDEQSPFIRRLTGLLSLPDVIQLRQGLPLPPLPVVSSSQGDYSDDEFGCLTREQFGAVAAIRRVVTGHRKRPLVLTADRGRGKSASLGIAAASLMSERTMRIGVTAPAYANTETLFAHAARRLGINNAPLGRLVLGDSELVFLAPDALLSDKPALDFLIVDEAAAIPAPMLNKLLRYYNRIAFASTVHGYEGTGRGFAIKFCQQLDVVTPQWRQLKINQPIRWADNDPLEQWVFNTLLLDAEYAALDTDSDVVNSDDIRYRYIPTDSLLGDETYLSQLFGLLVNAHYQTSPADLVQLLDDDAIHLVVAETKNHVVGCCLLSIEGGFTPELARQVMLGQRRPKGHLLAQSVAAHIGIDSAAIQSCARVLRIAVHPDRQQQGIGQLLLQHCRRWAVAEKLDYLGTSFGMASELVEFWRKAGYTPVRLGVSKDAASGSHSLLMIQPISPESETWVRQAQSLFAANLNAQRVEQYRDLDTLLFSQLYFFALDGVAQLPHYNTHLGDLQVRIYANGGLGYDLVVASLEMWLSDYLSGKQQALDTNDYMAVAKILQRQPWSTIVSDYGFTSRKMAEKSLREYVSLRAQ
ncbi:tRNA(Met) cytidine acetyltransferase TmcA [Photobacterium alginatilyticum]|uniref:tRNA(Met) cytidine acetyltransferase TmcA n=1 Tax=Photobacterium alginatilyticum TaxID=1775171 RepID=A0ABW9YFH7_9GAMM|nr:GNAT family N-acetyltransferase [Photobacterium alginatilyticum]NBI52539.1 tRNA(Met) cytidine acetyltransferase [Photobacterium alginatilyticum]